MIKSLKERRKAPKAPQRRKDVSPHLLRKRRRPLAPKLLMRVTLIRMIKVLFYIMKGTKVQTIGTACCNMRELVDCARRMQEPLKHRSKLCTGRTKINYINQVREPLKHQSISLSKNNLFFCSLLLVQYVMCLLFKLLLFGPSTSAEGLAL